MRGAEWEQPLRDGRLVSVWDGGDPAGRPVVFFHGCPDSRRAAVAGHEAARGLGVRLVAASRPGYSRSGLPHGAASVPSGTAHLEVADDTAELADLLGIGVFAVLGMSVGGPYALAAASRFPDRVRVAGVVESPAEVPSLQPAVHRDGLDQAGRAFFRSLAGRPPSEVAELMRPEFEAYVAGIDPTDPDDAALAARWLATLSSADASLVAVGGDAEVAQGAREALGRASGYLRDAAVSFRAWEFDPGEIRCPIFAWSADGDATYSPRNGEWLARALGATHVRVAGASHLGTLLEHWPELLGVMTDR